METDINGNNGPVEGGATFVNKLYENLTYFDQYSNSVILFIIITILIITLYLYFFILAKRDEIKEDWVNQKCNPAIIPFAGLINKPYNKSVSEFTQENYTYCMQNTLKNITGESIQPLAYTTNLFKLFYEQSSQNLNDMRSVFNDIRERMSTITSEVMGRMLNVVVPLQQATIGVKDSMAKTQGILTAGLFTSLGSYMTLQSVLGAIAKLIVNILYGMIATIIALWLLPFTWGAAASMTAIFVSISIPLAIMVTFLAKVMKVPVSPVPSLPNVKKGGADIGKAIVGVANKAVKGVTKTANIVGKGVTQVANVVGEEITDVANVAGKEITKVANVAGEEITDVANVAGKEITGVASNVGKAFSSGAKKAGRAISKAFCFDDETKIQMEDGSHKSIIDIMVSDKLHDGSVITGKMILTADNSEMFLIDGTIVSSTHSVLDGKEWMKVKDYTNKQKIGFYSKPFLVCLNTNKKKIQINNTVYSDWDELNDDGIIRIKENINHFTKDYTKVYTVDDIHKYLDGGFDGETLIKLSNETMKPIKNICVGDILEKGEIVCGVVEIDGKMISQQYEVNLGKNKKFIGGQNLNIISKKMSETRVMYLDIAERRLLSNIEKRDKLYHLLTDKGKFKIGSLKFHDYNSCIDLF